MDVKINQYTVTATQKHSVNNTHKQQGMLKCCWVFQKLNTHAS